MLAVGGNIRKDSQALRDARKRLLRAQRNDGPEYGPPGPFRRAATRRGRISARPLVEQAYQAKPEDLEIALSLARIFLRLKNYHEIPHILLPHIENSEVPKFEILFILGRTYQFIGELDKAIEIFDKTISWHGLNTSLLNALGECYRQAGNTRQALASWIKSLEINTDQPEIRKNVEELKENK